MSTKEAFDALLSEAKRKDPTYLQQQIDALKARVNELRIALDAQAHPVQNYIVRLDCTVDDVLGRIPEQSLEERDREVYDAGYNKAIDDCENEVVASVNVLLKPHMAGVFAVIRNKAIRQLSKQTGDR